MNVPIQKMLSNEAIYSSTVRYLLPGFASGGIKMEPTKDHHPISICMRKVVEIIRHQDDMTVFHSNHARPRW